MTSNGKPSPTDSERFSRAVADCARNSEEALDCALKLKDSVEKDKKREGISLLEVKNHDLLAYLSDMAYLMERMSCGNSIQNCPSIERTAKYRTILEKIRPIEHKMKSQIEKLTQTTATGSSKSLRARPELMELNDNDRKAEEEESDSDDDNNDPTNNEKYVPPKIMAVYYNDEADKEKRQQERNQKRAMQSTLIQELKQQYSEAPMEEFDEVGLARIVRQKEKERESHEMEYLRRTNLSKEEIKRKNKAGQETEMHSLLKFGDYVAADDDLRNSVVSSKKASRKRQGGPMSGRGNKKMKIGMPKKSRGGFGKRR